MAGLRGSGEGSIWELGKEIKQRQRADRSGSTAAWDRPATIQYSITPLSFSLFAPSLFSLQIDESHKRTQARKAVMMPINSRFLHLADWTDALCSQSNCQVDRFGIQRMNPDRADMLS